MSTNSVLAEATGTIAILEKGEKGAVERPRNWSEIPSASSMQSGASGESYIDIVLYADNWYQCIKSYTYSSDILPTNTIYFKNITDYKRLATGLFLASKAYINNLGVDNILITSEGGGSGDVYLRADKNGIVCNQGIFNGVTVTGTGSDGRSIVLSGGMLQIFGTANTSQPNIVFGVDETGAAILSYYSNDGVLLYDLGPSGLDAKGMTSASLTSIILVLMSNVTSAATLTTTQTLNDKSYTVCYDSSVQNALFGFAYTYDIVDADYSGYQPAKSKATVTLYKYTAARLNGTYVADTSRGLTTAALAEAANGKVFTSNTTLASGGKLTNLASGTYISPSAKSLLRVVQFSSTKKINYLKYMISYVTYADGIPTNVNIYSIYTKEVSESGSSGAIS